MECDVQYFTGNLSSKLLECVNDINLSDETSHQPLQGDEFVYRGL